MCVVCRVELNSTWSAFPYHRSSNNIYHVVLVSVWCKIFPWCYPSDLIYHDFPKNQHVLLLMDLLVFLNFSQCSLYNLHINTSQAHPLEFQQALCYSLSPHSNCQCPGIVILIGAANLTFNPHGDSTQEHVHGTCSIFPVSHTSLGSAECAELWSLPLSGLWSFIQFSISYRQTISKVPLNYLHKWSYTSSA